MRSFIALLVAAFASAALAQENDPNKPIRMVVGFPPGGGADVAAG